MNGPFVKYTAVGWIPGVYVDPEILLEEGEEGDGQGLLVRGNTQVSQIQGKLTEKK